MLHKKIFFPPNVIKKKINLSRIFKVHLKKKKKIKL